MVSQLLCNLFNGLQGIGFANNGQTFASKKTNKN